MSGYSRVRNVSGYSSAQNMFGYSPVKNVYRYSTVQYKMCTQIYGVILGFAKIGAVDNSSYFTCAVIELLSLHITCWLLYSSGEMRCKSSS